MKYCPGYNGPPFDVLAAEYPAEETYPAHDFRTEWGPIFHRGRLDGSARVLVLGQDPATHESVTRRILVGEAGQRVQGLLARVGITTSYVMINTFVYSVYGQGGGERHAGDPAIAEYRNRWLDALLHEPVTAVVTLGTLADKAYRAWAKTQPAAAKRLHHAALRHPTFPESASAASGTPLAETTANLLENWNERLPALRAHVQPDDPATAATPRPYADHWEEGDLAVIPHADLPAGHPDWWTSLEGWAARTGPDAQTKRATVTITIPKAARTWLGPAVTPAAPAG